MERGDIRWWECGTEAGGVRLPGRFRVGHRVVCKTNEGLDGERATKYHTAEVPAIRLFHTIRVMRVTSTQTVRNPKLSLFDLANV